MKIIGGTYRSRLLKAPKGSATRPTLAISRKALFDILQADIEGAHFLDLFAGSGLIGLEALSRGAAHTTFVENDRSALHVIKENIQTLHVEQQTSILSFDALHALRTLAKKKKAFDIIYIDPPYALIESAPILSELLLFIDTHALLKTDGTLFIEAPAGLAPPALTLPSLQLLNSRTFSGSALHLYRTRHALE
jgi:16S rRNA (guanine966-N2)-methyltransferase